MRLTSNLCVVVHSQKQNLGSQSHICKCYLTILRRDLNRFYCWQLAVHVELDHLTNFLIFYRETNSTNYHHIHI